jgi:hypothetical protein
LHIADLSLTGILEHLTTRAYSKPCGDPEGSFLLAPSAIAFGASPEGLSRTLSRIYQHARDWAPGLDIPWFVPPVHIATLDLEAGHFRLDEDSYASIAVSTEYLGSIEATSLILAHEACHHILLQSGVSYQFKEDVILNERITDLTMFVCGFGEIVRCGYSVVHKRYGQYVNMHLGYLDSREYDAANRYVLAKRKVERLPGMPIRPSVWAYLCKQIGGLMNQSAWRNRNSSLLEKIIEEDERRNRHRRSGGN